VSRCAFVRATVLGFEKRTFRNFRDPRADLDVRFIRRSKKKDA